MPNWCENDLSISGPRESLEKIAALVKTEDEEFDFNTIIPEPAELQDICSGFATIDGKQFSNWRVIDGEKVGVTDEEKAELIEKYGSSNLYDWHCENWDTKWGACEASFNDNGDSLFISFDTAWSPPNSIIDKLIRMFPECSFVHEYFEGGCCFQGGRLHNEGDDPDNDRSWEGEYCGPRGG